MLCYPDVLLRHHQYVMVRVSAYKCFLFQVFVISQAGHTFRRSLIKGQRGPGNHQWDLSWWVQITLPVSQFLLSLPELWIYSKNKIIKKFKPRKPSSPTARIIDEEVGSKRWSDLKTVTEPLKVQKKSSDALTSKPKSFLLYPSALWGSLTLVSEMFQC